MLDMIMGEIQHVQSANAFRCTKLEVQQKHAEPSSCGGGIHTPKERSCDAHLVWMLLIESLDRIVLIRRARLLMAFRSLPPPLSPCWRRGAE